MKYKLTGIFLSLAIVNGAFAESLQVQVMNVQGQNIGSVTFEDSSYGLLITPNLSSLKSGAHGFHLHEHPDCADHAMKAGGHWDPKLSNKHLGPFSDGHLGDLPVLFVDDKGNASTPVLAPRLTIKDLSGHSLMIHEGGDNYSDNPPLGGGGARVACGVIKAN